MKADSAWRGNAGVREDVLRKFGANDGRDLFPVPMAMESLSNVVRREQHEQLMDHVLNAAGPVLIHADGGVGKSVVTRQICARVYPVALTG